MPPRHERRLIEPHFDEYAVGRDRFWLDPFESVHNFRVLRGWTQEIAAAWWGVSTRTWQRWESRWYDGGVPLALLKRIEEWARRACPENVKYVKLRPPARG